MVSKERVSVNADSAPSTLFLAGYVRLAGHGFALPCFAISPRPNTWYTAVCSIDGDHARAISGFELFESDDIQTLPDANLRSADIGSPWLDVFLWSGVAHVGTPEEIWGELAASREAISSSAPLSLLDLGLSVSGQDVRSLVARAKQFMESRYGVAKSEEWQLDTLIRQQVLIRIRRLANEMALTVEAASALSMVELTQTAAAEARLEIPTVLRKIFASAGQMDRLRAETREIAARLGFALTELPANVVALTPDDGPARGEPAPDTQNEEEHNLVGGIDIMVIVSGERAREIARHLSAPEWVPDWLAGGRFVKYGLQILTSKTPQIIETPGIPAVHIVDHLSLIPSLARYSVVVALADDDVLINNASSEVLTTLMERSNAEAQGVTLLAPALPVDRPSDALTTAAAEAKLSNFGFDTLIDTAAARSPFWWGNPRRALDSRAADIVLAAALLCAGDSPLARKIREHRPGGRGSLLTFALDPSGQGRRKAAQGGSELGLASESTWAGRPDLASHGQTLWSARFSGQGTSRSAHQRIEGVIELRDRHAEFENFAGAVIADLAPARVAQNKTKAVPSDVLRTLIRGEMSAGFPTDDPNLAGIAVTAEAPSLDALRAGARTGWAVVRYTDHDTLRDVISDKEKRAHSLLPQELRLPKIERLARNRGLATRGIDPRDVIRFSQKDWDTWYRQGKRKPMATFRGFDVGAETGGLWRHGGRYDDGRGLIRGA
jgi:hypothetical protein